MLMPKVTKKPLSLSPDAAVVARAQTCGINPSTVADEASREAVYSETVSRWRAENATAIDGYNQMVEKSGVLSDRASIAWAKNRPAS
jgi:antitoxin CcdA